MKKTILYYTCNTHAPEIEAACRRQLQTAGLPIVSVSLNQELDFGDERITLAGTYGPLTMFWQILHGLRRIRDGLVFLCENDMLYHPSHFAFEPPSQKTFYFNTNVFKFWVADGLITWTDDLQQNSGLCAEAGLLQEFAMLRIDHLENNGPDRHYEPHARFGCVTENWSAEFPNVDLRHGKNLTRSHRSAGEFRNPRHARGFQTPDHIPYWGDAEAIRHRLKG